MTKSKKMSSHSQPGPTLFDAIVETTADRFGRPPTWGLDIEKQLKAALAEDLRHAQDDHGREISRAAIAARMSDALGKRITDTMIDNWTAPSHKHYMPLHFLPAWVDATGRQMNAAELISRCSGFYLLPGPEALRADIQRLEEEEKRIKSEKQKRKFYLKELESRRGRI